MRLVLQRRELVRDVIRAVPAGVHGLLPGGGPRARAAARVATPVCPRLAARFPLYPPHPRVTRFERRSRPVVSTRIEPVTSRS